MRRNSSICKGDESSYFAFETLETRQLLSSSAIPAIGALGDSFTDEYQFYGVRDAGQNWVEQLADNGLANFGQLSTNAADVPQLAGFSYNLGVSGAAADNLKSEINSLLPEVKSGKLQYVTIFIGGNDFEDGVLAHRPGATLRALPAHVFNDIAAGVKTLLNASPKVRVVISTLEELEETPRLENLVTGGTIAKNTLVLADAEQAVVNTDIKKLASRNSRIAVADYATHLDSVYKAGGYKIGDVHITTSAYGSDPHDYFLADGEHIGTIEQGILADLFINAIDGKFGQSFKRLSNAQILTDAGLT